MSISLNVKAVSSKENKEFKKHYKAVVFCVENNLSYPKETNEFFKGKIGGDDLDDITGKYILDYIKDGVEIDLETSGDGYNEIRIKISDIPKEVSELIVSFS